MMDFLDQLGADLDAAYPRRGARRQRVPVAAVAVLVVALVIGGLMLRGDDRRPSGASPGAPSTWRAIAALLGPGLRPGPVPAAQAQLLRRSTRHSGAGPLDFEHVFQIPPPAGAEAENTPGVTGVNRRWFVVPSRHGYCLVTGPTSECGPGLGGLRRPHASTAVHSSEARPFIAFYGVVPRGVATVRLHDRDGRTLAEAPVATDAFYVTAPGLYRGRHAQPYPRITYLRADGTPFSG